MPKIENGGRQQGIRFFHNHNQGEGGNVNVPLSLLLESPYPPLRIGPTASKSLREWGGTQKRRKIKNFKLANVEMYLKIAGRPLLITPGFCYECYVIVTWCYNESTADPIRQPLAGNGVGLRESDACIELAAHLSAWRACAFLRVVSSTSSTFRALSSQGMTLSWYYNTATTVILPCHVSSSNYRSGLS
eukprot:scaffold33505_cov101-Skeletonema_dohrnii-CCMP3373.AAC.3